MCDTKSLYVCSWGQTAGVAAMHGAYRSPLDDAYQYYAFQNPLVAGIGARKSVVDCYSLNSRGTEDQIEIIIAGCVTLCVIWQVCNVSGQCQCQ